MIKSNFALNSKRVFDDLLFVGGAGEIFAIISSSIQLAMEIKGKFRKILVEINEIYCGQMCRKLKMAQQKRDMVINQIYVYVVLLTIKKKSIFRLVGRNRC